MAENPTIPIIFSKQKKARLYHASTAWIKTALSSDPDERDLFDPSRERIPNVVDHKEVTWNGLKDIHAAVEAAGKVRGKLDDRA